MRSYSSEWEWDTQGPSQTLREIYMCVYTLLHVCKKGRRVFQHVCLKKMCMYVYARVYLSLVCHVRMSEMRDLCMCT